MCSDSQLEKCSKICCKTDSVIKETSPQGWGKGDHKVKLRLGKAPSEVFVSDPRRGGDVTSCGQRAARGFGTWLSLRCRCPARVQPLCQSPPTSSRSLNHCQQKPCGQEKTKTCLQYLTQRLTRRRLNNQVKGDLFS